MTTYTDNLNLLLTQNESFRNTMAYSLAMAMTEDSKFPPLTRGLDARMMEQLRVSKTQLKSSSRRSQIDVQKLPRTLKDALRQSSRAIVVTETTRPFQVYDVNKAWEGLCGYSYLESRGKSLGDLLKGPETDPSAVTSLLHQLFRGEDATTVLTNYTKSGRKFRNRLSVGPLYDEDGKNITHFVGVLQEVNM
jgi:PAS domain S-box-containing protein